MTFNSLTKTSPKSLKKITRLNHISLKDQHDKPNSTQTTGELSAINP